MNEIPLPQSLAATVDDDRATLATPNPPVLAGRLAELLRLSGTYPVTGSSTASPSVVSSTNA